MIEFYNLGKDRKRRIVHDDAAVRVVVAFVVAARVERSNEIRAIHAILLLHPRHDRVVNVIRRVAVVCRFLRLELLKERVVLLVSLLPFGPVLVLSLEEVRTLRVEIVDVKPERAHVDLCDALELQRLDGLVPPAQLGGPVVRERVCPALLVAHVVQSDHRHLRQTETPCGHQATVSLDDDVPRPPDPDRIPETEDPDAFHRGLDVFFTVRPRVPFVRSQRVERQVFDPHFVHASSPFLSGNKVPLRSAVPSPA